MAFRVYRTREPREEKSGGRARAVPKKQYFKRKDGTVCEFERKQSARNFARNRRMEGWSEIVIEEIEESR